jgi:hypothetical protein
MHIWIIKEKWKKKKEFSAVSSLLCMFCVCAVVPWLQDINDNSFGVMFTFQAQAKLSRNSVYFSLVGIVPHGFLRAARNSRGASVLTGCFVLLVREKGCTVGQQLELSATQGLDC